MAPYHYHYRHLSITSLNTSEVFQLTVKRSCCQFPIRTPGLYLFCTFHCASNVFPVDIFSDVYSQHMALSLNSWANAHCLRYHGDKNDTRTA